MANNYNNKFTPIDSLPFLEDLEEDNYSNQGKEYNSSEYDVPDNKKYSKFIRQSYFGKPESGMGHYQKDQPNVHREGPHSSSHKQPPLSRPNMSNVNFDNELEFNSYKTFNIPHNSPTCLDVAEHIANCPICSKFYNNDKTIYIITIVVLAIICIMLLKKVLDI